MLKKSILAALALAFFAANIAAQRIGLRAGLNISTLPSNVSDNTDFSKASPAMGATAGIFVDLMPKRAFSIQPEVYFAQKGSSYSLQGTSGPSFESRTNINFGEAAVLAKIRPWASGEHGLHGLYFFGGPFAGRAFSGKLTYKNPVGESSSSITFDDSDDWGIDRRLDWGAVLGAGLNFDRFFVDVRYNLGLANLMASDFLLDNGKTAILRTRSIGVGAGVNFGAGSFRSMFQKRVRCPKS